MKNHTLGMMVFLCALVVMTGCQDGSSDGGGGSGGGGSGGGGSPEFVWTKPTPPDGQASFKAVELDPDAGTKGITSRWLTKEKDSVTSIEADGLKVAYRYIAMIRDSVVLDIGKQGIYGRKQTEPWSSAALTSYKGNTMTKLPGFNRSHYPDATVDENSMVEFDVYVDESTPIQASQVKQNAFVIFDGTNGTVANVADDSLAIFDLKGNTSFPVTVDAVPPVGVEYTGIAYELVYYEATLNGYGAIRLYYNDFGTYKAGDFVVNREGDTPDAGWQWAYLKHGDGPDSFDGSSVPQVTDTATPTIVTGYDQVNDHGTMKNYDGTYLYNAKAVPTFLVDMGPSNWSSVEGTSNRNKRPLASQACMYWVAANHLFNGNSLPDPHVRPHLEDAANPGGFGTYNQEAPNTSTPLGSAGGTTIRTSEDANLIYYETDDHLGPADMSSVFYSNARLATVSRNHMTDYFGVYAYDSGIFSNIYDDTQMFRAFSYKEGVPTYTDICPTLLDLSMGRLCVLGRRYPQEPGKGPTGYAYDPPRAGTPGYLEEAIVEISIQLEIEVALHNGEDCLGRAWGGGTAIGAADFEKRFLSFAPKVGGSEYAGWGSDPNGPVPLQRGFYGAAADDHGLETDLRFKLESFMIQITNVCYRDVYTLAPRITPSAKDGPFASQVQATISKHGDPSDEDTTIYYTLDGSDPTNSSSVYTAGIPISSDTVLKAIAVADNKLYPSKVTEMQYVFQSTSTYDVAVTVESTPATAVGKPAFIALFMEEKLSLDHSLEPVFHTTSSVAIGSLGATLKGVSSGTYYALVIIDMDRSDSLSEGDLIYPNEVSTKVVTLKGVTVPGSSITLTGSDSYSVPAKALGRSLALTW